MNYYKKPDLTVFRFSITWLEKYIEVKELLPNWQSKKQTDTSVIRRNWTKNTPESEILDTIGTSLHLSCACSKNWPNKVSDEKREAYKSEFYKWIDATEINNDNCPKQLKLVLFAFHEIAKDKAGGLKIHKEAEEECKKHDHDSPEYKEKLQNLYSFIGETHANGKAFEVDESRFSGDEKAGKKTFVALANSLTAEEKENFHFFPQITDQEKSEADLKNKQGFNQTGEHHILRAKKDHAIKEITQALHQEPKKITNNDLELKNQNWNTEIEQNENIFKIQDLQNRVLADIKTKRQFFSRQDKDQKTYKTFLIAGVILVGLIFTIALLFFYYWKKKNIKRKYE